MVKALNSKPRRAIISAICVLFAMWFVGYAVLDAKPKIILPDDEFAFGPIPQNAQQGNIEGIYFHRALRPGDILDEFTCKTDGWDNCTSYVLFRFYDDGIVISVSIGTDDGIQAEDLPNLEQWFNRDSEELSHGEYFISGNELWFSTTANYDGDVYFNYESDNNDDWHVTVDYSGKIIGNKLLIDSYSHYNGFARSNEVYKKLSNDH